MIDIATLKKHPKEFYSLFFISPNDFDNLVSRVKPKWAQKERQLRFKTNKKHKILTIGSGRLFKCTLEERVAMYLLYHHTYVSHVFLGELFGIDNSRISQYFKYLKPIILESYDYTDTKFSIHGDEILNIINSIDK